MRNKSVVKEAVLESAMTLIERDGIEKCSMRRIASELDIAVGTLYNYYKSRDALLMEVFDVSWKQTIEKAYNIVDHKRPKIEQIESLFKLVIKDVKRRNGLGRQVLMIENTLKASKTLTIKSAIGRILEEIVCVNGEEQEVIFANWLSLILIDLILKGKAFTINEKDLLKKMIEII